jgi:hypothetical protein
MNLLPFVTVIITVLALFSSAFLQKHIIEKKECALYKAYFKGLREVRNQKEGKAYTSLMKKSGTTEKKPSSISSSKTRKKGYFRDEKIGLENGMLNLSSLVSSPEKWPQLKGVAIKYIYHLYGNKGIFPENSKFVENLLESLVKEYQKDEIDDETELYDLELCDPYTVPFYKMLKGTRTYNLETGVGYPPFGDFFTFKGREKAPMFFQDANTTFLQVAFGAKPSKLLIQAELKKSEKSNRYHAALNREELENVFSTAVISPQLLDLFEYAYQKSSNQKMLSVTDAKTHLTVQAP